MAAKGPRAEAAEDPRRGRLRVASCRLIVAKRTTGIDASRPFRRSPAIVSFLNPQPALSLVGGNRSSCPTPAIPSPDPRVSIGWESRCSAPASRASTANRPIRSKPAVEMARSGGQPSSRSANVSPKESHAERANEAAQVYRIGMRCGSHLAHWRAGTAISADAQNRIPLRRITLTF